jgi:hypothetical protein
LCNFFVHFKNMKSQFYESLNFQEIYIIICQLLKYKYYNILFTFARRVGILKIRRKDKKSTGINLF